MDAEIVNYLHCIHEVIMSFGKNGLLRHHCIKSFYCRRKLRNDVMHFFKTIQVSRLFDELLYLAIPDSNGDPYRRHCMKSSLSIDDLRRAGAPTSSCQRVGIPSLKISEYLATL